MTIAAAGIILGFIVATAYGAGFHLIVGGRLFMVAIYLVCAWIGFTLGHFVGESISLTFLRLGVVQLFSGSIGAWVMLVLGRWLFSINTNE